MRAVSLSPCPREAINSATQLSWDSVVKNDLHESVTAITHVRKAPRCVLTSNSTGLEASKVSSGRNPSDEVR